MIAFRSFKCAVFCATISVVLFCVSPRFGGGSGGFYGEVSINCGQGGYLLWLGVLSEKATPPG